MDSKKLNEIKGYENLDKTAKILYRSLENLKLKIFKFKELTNIKQVHPKALERAKGAASAYKKVILEIENRQKSLIKIAEMIKKEQK